MPTVHIAPLLKNQPIDLLIIAGEHSGDEQAARYVKKIRAEYPDWHIVAFGGKRLADSGVDVVYDMTVSSVVGFWEVIRRYPFFAQLFKKLLQWIRDHQPKRILFVDYPGFNLRVAKALKKQSLSKKGGGAISLYYYISPQIWAWKGARRFEMAKTLDALAVIFPFEVAYYQDTDLPVYFVGHPFMDADYQSPVKYNSGGAILLLPGSRKGPVSRIFPLMLKGLEAYFEKSEKRPVVILYPSERIHQVLLSLLKKQPQLASSLQWVSNDNPSVIEAAAVLTSSGTMSLSCALAGIPGAIVYKASWITYLLGRYLIKIPYLGIANWLLNEAFYPEFIQHQADPMRLANELNACLKDPERIQKTVRLSEALRQLLSADKIKKMPIAD